MSVDADVLVVGGSLVGLSAALALSSRGLSVLVLERNIAPWPGGTGFTISRDLISHVTGSDATGRDPATPAIPVLIAGRELVRWRSVHEWLRARVAKRPGITLLEGTEIAELGQDSESAWALTADGRRFSATILVGADGYRSLVRRSVDPLSPGPRYAGYVIWRGLVEERSMPADTPWPWHGDGLFANTPEGYRIVGFPVPGADQSNKPGHRAISLGWFEARRDTLLESLGAVRDGQVLTTLSPAQIPTTLIDELKRVAPLVWPQPWLNAIMTCLNQRTMIGTPVAEHLSPWMAHGRFALLGDAAHAVTPPTGRGLIEGLLDVQTLAEALTIEPQRPERALQLFAGHRHPQARQLVSLSRELSASYLRWAGVRPPP